MKNTCNYSDEWQPYIGDYDKFEYEIKLKDGRTIDNCYPNGGLFNSISEEHDKEVFPESDVLEIRFSQNPKFGINDGVSNVDQSKYFEQFVAQGNIGKALINTHTLDALVIDETFEVNGVKWRRIPEKPKPKLSSSTSKALMLASMFGAMDGWGDSIKIPKLVIPEGSSLVGEYGKIQRKESTLTRSQRDSIVYTFERKYEKVE
jgi:hypothetical protein